jgi:hypothetical protein
MAGCEHRAADPGDPPPSLDGQTVTADSSVGFNLTDGSKANINASIMGGPSKIIGEIKSESSTLKLTNMNMSLDNLTVVAEALVDLQDYAGAFPAGTNVAGIKGGILFLKVTTAPVPTPVSKNNAVFSDNTPATEYYLNPMTSGEDSVPVLIIYVDDEFTFVDGGKVVIVNQGWNCFAMKETFTAADIFECDWALSNSPIPPEVIGLFMGDQGTEASGEGVEDGSNDD